MGAKFQIILDRNANRQGIAPNLVPFDAEVFDLDLFDTPVQTIQEIHARGAYVVCYFSAGGSESWRADYREVSRSDLGERMKKWPGERWLNIRSPAIFRIMQKRIALAKQKGCDGLDADNTGKILE